MDLLIAAEKLSATKLLFQRNWLPNWMWQDESEGREGRSDQAVSSGHHHQGNYMQQNLTNVDNE